MIVNLENVIIRIHALERRHVDIKNLKFSRKTRAKLFTLRDSLGNYLMSSKPYTVDDKTGTIRIAGYPYIIDDTLPEGRIDCDYDEDNS